MMMPARRRLHPAFRVAVVVALATALLFTMMTVPSATTVAAEKDESCAASGGEADCPSIDTEDASPATDSGSTETDQYSGLANFEFPKLCAVFFVYENSPFLDHVLDSFYSQDYAKEDIDLHLMVLKGYHSSAMEQIVHDWLAKYGASFSSAKQTTVFSFKDHLLNDIPCLSAESAHHILFTDSRSHLTNPFAVKHLVMENRYAVSPVLSRQNKYWSNFWDDAAYFGSETLSYRQLTNSEDSGPQPPTEVFNPADVTYVRSDRYLGIVEGKNQGTFVVPIAFSTTLFHQHAIAYLRKAISMMSPEAARAEWHFSLSLCYYLGTQGVELAVTNTVSFGHLIDPTLYNPAKIHPELFLVETNPFEWSAKYLNEEYQNFAAHGDKTNCSDVYLVPMFSATFAAHLIDECEAFGQWSGGDHNDERIQGGYEPVPTQDIHFNQIGFKESWKYILRTYLRPITSFHYMGYTLSGEETLDFVVRYRPDKQDYLRPHHDASTVTLNVALNRGNGVDYSGGGTHFLRQNCTMLDVAPGWGTLSPGRLTHLHEGLKTTAGTRYILVSFIDQ